MTLNAAMLVGSATLLGTTILDNTINKAILAPASSLFALTIILTAVYLHIIIYNESINIVNEKKLREMHTSKLLDVTIKGLESEMEIKEHGEKIDKLMSKQEKEVENFRKNKKLIPPQYISHIIITFFIIGTILLFLSFMSEELSTIYNCLKSI